MVLELLFSVQRSMHLVVVVDKLQWMLIGCLSHTSDKDKLLGMSEERKKNWIRLKQADRPLARSMSV